MKKLHFTKVQSLCHKLNFSRNFLELSHPIPFWEHGGHSFRLSSICTHRSAWALSLPPLWASPMRLPVLLRIVQGLLDVLYTGELQNIDLADINLGIIEVKLLSDGDVAYVNLLGLQISVSLGEPDDTGNKTVHVTIGDSEITLHCSEDGKLLDGNTIEIKTNNS